MPTIHHFYRCYHITFHDGRYHVQNDQNPQDPWCDTRLTHSYLKSAKRYVDVLWDIMICPHPEPFNSMQLEPFYKGAHRADGPLPSMFRLSTAHVANTCAHVCCDVTRQHLAGGNLWHYCGKPVKRGSSRCMAHEDHPERYEHKVVEQD